MPSSRNFDLEYDDYKERRNAAGMGSRASSRNGRFKPIDAEKEKKKQEVGEFGLPSNEYQMQGYKEKRSDVGADALASVRTLRNNLRVMSLEHRDKDEPVKAHLCQSACDDLSKAERQLVEMSHRRSDAVVRGDTKQVEKIAADMDRVKSDAIRNAYSDLMMDDGTMKAFGVNSKWTPDKNPMPPDDWKPMTPMKPRKRAETPNGRRTESRQSVRGNNDNGERRMSTRSAERRIIPKEETKPKPIRKNQRLSAVGREPEAIPVETPLLSGSTVQDDPYKMPTYVGKCPHCQVTENGLGRSGGMEKHYSRYCKVMTSCKYCMKLTMVSQLTDHMIYRCEFLLDTMEACNECGLAMDKEDQRRGAGHPMCRGRRPPSGAQWCPLCTIAVEDNEEGWREHLTSNCYNNPRRDGPEKDPWEMKQEQDDILRKARERKQREKEEEEARKRAEEARKQQQVMVNNSGYPGKMIDADKLVVALQEIQEKKKAEKKKRLKEVEKENTAT
ncbi:unnamed protein product [Caenorhabditis sp. 36 PRJEB53466]|nr:unnamed protein product [Caenorhabditis sp. 36 PRJEB53466]